MGESAPAAVPWVAPLFDASGLNPLSWLGEAASEAVGQSWTAVMVAVWSSGLWMLGLAFRVVDASTSPDLTAGGPMREIYPYTFGLGLLVAVAMAFVQIGVAAIRRDGQSLGRVLVGVAQFGAVWLGYVGIAAALVVAASGLTRGLLDGLLGIDGFGGYQPSKDFPRDVTDTVTATVLGVCAWLLIWPASIGYLLIMLVREAALLLLAATSPIAAGGLVSELGRTWFWRSLRWFVSALLIAPLAALVLGVGHKIGEGVASGAGTDTPAAVGTAVVASVLVLIGAICPLILFRLLAFVDPGTSSGAAMRAALTAHRGVRGLLPGGGSRTGSAATQGDGTGRSAGEASADAATRTRFAASAGSGAVAALGAAGAVVTGLGKLAQGAVAVGSDVLNSAGVGHEATFYPYHPAAPAAGRDPHPATRRSDPGTTQATPAEPDPPDPGTTDRSGPPATPPTTPTPPPAAPVASAMVEEASSAAASTAPEGRDG